MRAARAAYIGGFAAMSNVMAGKIHGLPLSGTMAHSYITAFDAEELAFEAFADSFAEKIILLIDTYDMEHGARKAAELGKRLNRQGSGIRGVRLDSGDMIELARKVRAILDEAARARKRERGRA